ncbi:hypothetical protein AAF712_009065 [Marasmius tenuissimus]|uniref:F-box domain-containing protein n=1 Tax=Marasmius tenuissimus TaxID=585030 RepID=A0ABR2ZSA5_9AGAR
MNTEQAGLTRINGSEDSIRATINTLPVELLTEIFAYFSPTSSNYSISPLLTFVSVCRHWRQTSFNASFLWSTIALVNPRPHRLPMVRQWLERSKNYPLTLKLEVHPTTVKARAEWQAISKTMEEALSLLVQHIHRWRSIDIQMESFPIRSGSPLLKLPSSSDAAPLLEQVNVYAGESFSTEGAEQFWDTIRAYPNVLGVLWETDLEEPESCFPELIATPWNRLTHLSSQFFVDDTFLDFLSRCHSLEELNITSLELSDEPLHFGERFTLPRLRKLSMVSYTPEAAIPLLHHLDAPLLDDLYLGEWHCPDAWEDMLQRSGCRLKTLLVSDRSFTDSEVPQWLLFPASTSVEELTVYLWCPADTILRALTWGDTKTKRLPSLRKLTMSVVAGFTGGLLKSMLSSRIHSDTNVNVLEDVNFTFGLGKSSGGIGDDLTFLDELRAGGGLDVTYNESRIVPTCTL